jgi:hypothetical protein
LQTSIGFAEHPNRPFANISIVLGVKEAMANPESPAGITSCIVALFLAMVCSVVVATGTLSFWELQAHLRLLVGFVNFSSTDALIGNETHDP